MPSQSPVRLAVLCTSVLFLTLSAPGAAAAELARGKAEMRSIGALEFGPGNVLFAGDSAGAAIYALEVEPPAGSGTGPMETVEDLDSKIAALLGTTPRDVFVKDMAVHRPSGSAYLSVMRGAGDNAAPVLVSVSRAGEVAAVDLDDIRHARLEMANAPAPDAKLYRWDSRTFTITDLEFIDGELYIAGLSNEEWASILRRTSWPFGDVKVTGLEIYHGAHGAWETFAPIFSFIPYEIGDETHLLAGYLCTPLVTFPLDEVRRKDRLRGKTIAELGWGNIPTDLVAYEKDGEGYVLIANNRRGTMRVKASDIAAAQAREGITREVGPRVGVEDETVPIGNVAQLADFNATHVLVLGRNLENGALYLQAASKSRL